MEPSPCCQFSLSASRATIPLHAGTTHQLGREVLGPAFAFVSRLQATVHCDAYTQALRLEILGSNPTGLLSCGATGWRWLAKGDSATLAVGDQIALSESDHSACARTHSR